MTTIIFDDLLSVGAIHSGAHRVSGVVTEAGATGSYRVRLFYRPNSKPVAETWSAADGSYSFDNIKYEPQGYYVIAFDHGDNPVNAAIADFVTPEPM